MKRFLLLLSLFSLMAEAQILQWTYPSPLPATNIVVNIYASSQLGLPIDKWNLLTTLTNPPVNELSVNVRGNNRRFFRGTAQFYNQVYQTNAIRLSWEKSPSSGIVGYLVNRGGVSGVYTNVSNLIRSQSTIITNLSNLTFFAVTARDRWGGISDFSNEVVYEPIFDMNEVAKVQLSLKIRYAQPTRLNSDIQPLNFSSPVDTSILPPLPPTP